MITGRIHFRKLVKDWNSEVIGCSTLSTYDDKVNFQDDFERIVKNVPLYIRELIWGDTKITIDGISRAELSVLMGYSVNKVNHILNFKKDRDTATIIQNEVDTLIKNIKKIEPVRLKTDTATRITDFRYIKQLSNAEWQLKYNMVWSNENFQFYKDYPNKVFVTREQLIMEMEKITDAKVKKIWLNEIRRVTDMEAIKIKSKDKRTKYLKYTEEELHTFIEKSNAKNKQPDKLLSIA